MRFVLRMACASVALLLAVSSTGRAQTWHIDAPLAINQAIQDALVWTGNYEGLVDGALGSRSVAAIAAFQRDIGAAATGDLSSEQKLHLLQQADQIRSRHGFQFVRDAQSNVLLGMPMGLVQLRSTRSSSSRYTSADGSLEINIKRMSQGTTMKDLYQEVLALPSMAEPSMKVLRSDAMFVAGESANLSAYFTAKFDGQQIIGFGVFTTPATRLSYSRLVVAMANAFHFGIPDYRAVAQRLAPPASAAPAVAGFVRRLEATTAEPAQSPFIARAGLVAIVQNIMAGAGVKSYKILPPDKDDNPSIWWVHEDGAQGALVALRPGSGMKIDEISNSAISMAAKSCKGEFATKRGASRYSRGSEITAVETICRTGDSVRDTVFSIIELPTGAILRFTHMAPPTALVPMESVERRTRLEDAVFALSDAAFR